MAEEMETKEDPDTGETIACLRSPQIDCNRAGENSTFTHTACLGGGTYGYVIRWGDTSGDLTVTGITLADNQSVSFNHTYETEGTYQTFFNASVMFVDENTGTESNLSTSEMPAFRVENETCINYVQTDVPTTSPAPSLAPTMSETSGGPSAVSSCIINTAVFTMLVFFCVLRSAGA